MWTKDPARSQRGGYCGLVTIVLFDSCSSGGGGGRDARLKVAVEVGNSRNPSTLFASGVQDKTW